MGSKKETRRKFGLAAGPIKATRVLQMELDHDFGVPAHSLISIDDEEGTFTSMNVYGGNLGRNYDPEGMTHPLPAPDSDKWKTWTKKGYEVGKVSDWDVLELVKPPVAKPEVAKS